MKSVDVASNQKKYLDILLAVIAAADADAQIDSRPPKPSGDFEIVEIAAGITLDVVEQDIVFLHLGRGTTFEILPRGLFYLPVDQAGQIRELAVGVIEGGFTEELVYSGDKIVFAKGIVRAGRKTMTMNRHDIRRFFASNTRRERIAYEPYSRIVETQDS